MSNKSFEEKATSSTFLQTRIKANDNATQNFEHWSINTFPKIPFKSNILDLGCGTGKQILQFSQLLTQSCNYYGCDISKESLTLIDSLYNSNPTLTLVNDSFDNILSFTDETIFFDLIYSFYALYYTQDLKKIITDIHSKLKEGGVFWVVMPYKNTNRELFSILEKIYPLDEKVIYSIDGFAKDLIEMSDEAGFKQIDVSLLENKIIFNTKEELLEYLKNTTFYNAHYHDQIVQHIDAKFNTPFLLTKEVISIKFTK